MTLDTQRLTSIAEMQAFLDGSQTLGFQSPDGAGRRRWLAELLARFHYPALARADKGVLRAFVRKVGSYSRAQLTRLIAQWQAGGRSARAARAALRPPLHGGRCGGPRRA